MNCCAFLSEHEAVGGTEDGSLWCVDVRSPRLAFGITLKRPQIVRDGVVRKLLAHMFY